MMNFALLLQASEAANKAQPRPGGLLNSLIGLSPFLIIIVVLYFVTIRPQKKEEKQKRERLSSLKPGDEIMTIGGVVGKVASIGESDVTIYTSVANTMLTFNKNAISQVMGKDDIKKTSVNTKADKSKKNDKAEKPSKTDDFE